jgi:hypothetical protein
MAKTEFESPLEGECHKNQRLGARGSDPSWRAVGGKSESTAANLPREPADQRELKVPRVHCYNRDASVGSGPH